MAAEILVALILCQRLVELVWAGRNTRRLRAQGAVEHGAAHYPAIVGLHALWLAVVAALAPGVTIGWGWVAGYALLQILRLWTIATLGPRWTTRVLVQPGSVPVRRGPFRVLRHPNYAIVACELALVPLALGAPLVALAFTVLNALAMAVRIPCENRALAR